jgi:hypothetical protein
MASWLHYRKQSRRVSYRQRPTAFPNKMYQTCVAQVRHCNIIARKKHFNQRVKPCKMSWFVIARGAKTLIPAARPRKAENTTNIPTYTYHPVCLSLTAAVSEMKICGAAVATRFPALSVKLTGTGAPPSAHSGRPQGTRSDRASTIALKHLPSTALASSSDRINTQCRA